MNTTVSERLIRLIEECKTGACRISEGPFKSAIDYIRGKSPVDKEGDLEKEEEEEKRYPQHHKRSNYVPSEEEMGRYRSGRGKVSTGVGRSPRHGDFIRHMRDMRSDETE